MVLVVPDNPHGVDMKATVYESKRNASKYPFDNTLPHLKDRYTKKVIVIVLQFMMQSALCLPHWPIHCSDY